MYWYMYRTCIGRDPTVQYLKKGIRDTIFGVSYPTFVPRSAAGVLYALIGVLGRSAYGVPRARALIGASPPARR